MLVASVLLALLLPTSTPQSQASTVGTVHFQTSCSKDLTGDFNHALALLYSFEYDEARDEFVAISKKDPTCAMAKWGEAMTYFHGLWGEYNAAGGSEAAQQAREIAAKNPATTPREKDFIAAISEIFSPEAIKLSEREGNKPNAQGYSEPAHAPEVAYKDKMAALHQACPGDDEATIFYALSLNIVASRADKSHPELHECTALLNPLFKKLPNHPGIAHYLVHCNDNPEMAQDGLVAARKYAQIAPHSAHATHMPSHIFAQLGLWDEMVASNRASLKAAEDDARASSCQKVGNTLHAMHYLVFALLQEGKLNEARDILARAAKVTSQVPGGDKCDDSDALLLSDYILETGEWNRAKQLDLTSDNYGTFPLLVKGVAAARTKDLTTAQNAESQLAKLRDSNARSSHHATADSGAEASRLAVAAWIADASGDRAKALKLIREAADMQDRLGGSPSVFKPIREMVADMLSTDGQNKEALVEYKKVLQTHPNRFNALYGAGTAAFAAGNSEEARKYFSALLKSSTATERPEAVTAREKLSAKPAQGT